MLWGALNAAEGRDLALPAYAHLPLLVNDRGKKLSKRRDPVAVEMYREQGYLPAAFRNYLALLGWSPGDEEIVRSTRSFRPSGWRTCSAHRPSSTSRSSRTSTASTSAPSRWRSSWRAARPWVDPQPGEWAPGGWRDPDTGAPAVEPPPWPAERFDAGTFAAVAAVAQERVSVLGEVPELVDFLFLEDAPTDADSWQKAIAGDEVAPRILDDAWRRTGRARGTRTRSTKRRWPSRRRWAASWVKAQRRSGWPSWGGPGASHCSTRWRCSAARRRSAAWRPRAPGWRRLTDAAGAAPLGAPHRLPDPRRDRPLLRRDLVQVWLTGRQYDPHPAGAILVMGAAQYDCVPSPDLAARLDQAAKLYHEGDAP